MDLLYPAQLVFHYERLMSLAFGLVARPIDALLLGVGGAAMWRFVRAYLPECAPTLVDCDESVVAIAGAGSHLSQPVVIDTAERFLAGNTQHFDIDARRSLQCARAGGVRRRLSGLARRRADAGRVSRRQLGGFRHQHKVRPITDAQTATARARALDTYLCDPARLSRQSDPVSCRPETSARPRRSPARSSALPAPAICPIAAASFSNIASFQRDFRSEAEARREFSCRLRQNSVRFAPGIALSGRRNRQSRRQKARRWRGRA